MDSAIGPEEYARRLADLCARGGRHAFPRRGRDKSILLHALSRRFDDTRGGSLDERAVGARISVWLQETGSALDVDAVSLRRALIDAGFLVRDADGRSYRPSRTYENLIRFDPAVGELDPDRIVADARLQAQERLRLFRMKAMDSGFRRNDR